MRSLTSPFSTGTAGRIDSRSADGPGAGAISPVHMLMAVLLATAVLVLAGCSHDHGDHAGGGDGSAASSQPGSAPGGMKAHVDPDTGELRDTPAPGTKPIEAGDVLQPKTMKPGMPDGMKAYIDPETGELRDTPAPGTEPVEGGDVIPPKNMATGKTPPPEGSH